MSLRGAGRDRHWPADENLVFSYREVLDATKHQEDKISRLLTAIAFLTAAVLALANLAGSDAVQQSFLVGTHGVRLSLLFLGIFLLSVIATVIILLSSVTAPLRFPGAPRAVDATKAPDVEWADPRVPVSQIYFHEIAGASLAEWYQKWAANEGRLRRERRDSLIRETHNLAVRTEYKYDRMNEAVLVLSFGLSALAVTSVLLLASLGQGAEVEFSPGMRASLGAVVFGYVWLQLFVASRDTLHAVEDLESASVTTGSAPKRSLALVRFAFPIVAAAVPATLVWVGGSAGLIVRLGCSLLAVVAWVMFFLISLGRRFRRGTGAFAKGVLAAARSSLDTAAWQSQIGAGITAVLYASVPAVAPSLGGFGLMLTAALASPCLLLVAGLTNLLAHRRRRLERYLARS